MLQYSIIYFINLRKNIAKCGRNSFEKLLNLHCTGNKIEYKLLNKTCIFSFPFYLIFISFCHINKYLLNLIKAN